MAKIQIKNSFITSSAQITISSSLVRFSDNIRAKGITGSFSGSFAGSNMFVQGGNSFGTTALLGTNDNQPLTLRTNNSEKMRVTAAGLVGIGTSNPGTKLQVVGDVTFGTSGGAGNLWILGDRDWRWIAGTTGYGVGSGFGLFDNTAGAYRITFDTNGNVGIGTTSPGALLAVNGESFFASKITIKGNTVGTLGNSSGLQLYQDASTDTSYIYNYYAGSMIFGTNNTARMTILSGGNVGIATSSPTAKLQVGTQMYGSAPDANYFVVGNENFSGPGPVGGISGYPTTANRNQVTASMFDVAGGWERVHGSHALLRVSAYDVINSTPALTVLNNGNVGMGTTAPISLLDVRSGYITAGSSASTNGSTILAGYYSNSAGILTVLGTEFSSGGPVLGYAVTPSTSGTGAFLSSTTITIPRSAYTQDGGTHRWFTGAAQSVAIGSAVTTSEKMRLDTNGNLGIGTSSTVDKLDINGNLYFSKASDPRIYAGSGVGLNIDGQALWLNRNTNASIIMVTGGGNVGIGTTSPSYKLDVVGTIAYTPSVGNPILISNDATYGTSGTGRYVAVGFGGLANSANKIFAHNTGEDGIYICSATSRNINFRAGGGATDHVTIKSDGNVGINTTAPAYKFHIYSGSMYVQGGAGAGVAKNYTSFSRLIFDTDHSDSTRGPNKITLYDAGGTWVGGFGVSSDIVGYYSGGHHVWLKSTSQTAFTEYMRLNSSGNLGIGSSSPSAKLDVVDSGAFFVTRDANGYPRFTVTNGSAQLGLFRTGTSAGGFYIGGDASLFSVWDSSFSRLVTINTSGNIGINVASPLTKLDIANTQANGITMRFDTTTNYQAWIRPYWNSNIDTRIDFAINRTSGATPDVIMSVGYGGNVGIGTTSPAAKLDVAGDIKVGSGTTSTTKVTGSLHVTGSITLNASRDSNWPFLISDPSTVGGSSRYQLGKVGAMGFNYADSYAQLQIIGSSGAYIDLGNSATDDLDARLIYFSNSRLQLEYGTQMAINSTGVGIGTTSPGSLLDVYSSTNGQVSINVRNPSTGVAAYAGLAIGNNNGTNAGGIVVFGSNWNTAGLYNPNGTYVYSNQSGGLVLASEASAPIIFGTNNTEKMRILSNGNVGIGSSSPPTMLQVVGTGVASVGTINIRGSQAHLGLTTAGGTFKGWYGYFNSSTHGSDLDLNIKTGYAGASNIRIAANGDATQLFISGSGNVGIGTTSPSIKLAVDGEASFGDGSKLTLIGLDINSQVTPNFIKIRTKIPFASGAADFTINIKGFRYGSAETTSLMICWHYYLSTFYSPTISSAGSYAPTVKLSAEDWDSSGTPKVCIVLVSPGYWPKLYVESMYSSAYNDAYADGWDWVDADATGTGNNLAILSYKSNFGNSFVMLSNGSVGIGTVSPAYKLDVNGTGYFSSTLQVNSNITLSGGGDVIINDSDGTGFFASYMDSGVGYIRIDDGGTANGSLNINNGRLFVGPSTGNVGIGTTSPASLLQVGGSSGATATPTAIQMDNTFRNAVGGNTSLKFYLYRNTANSETYGFGLNNAGGIEYHAGNSGGTAANHAFYTETTEKMRLNSSGNLGIGTTSPGGKLEVRTNANSNYVFSGTSTSGYTTTFTMDDTASYFGHDSGVRSLILRTNSTARLTVLGGGNVGIGTTSPSTTLTVIATNNTGSRIQLGTASNSTFMDANKVNDFMVMTAPFGASPASVSNGGAKWGIKLNGSIDTINTKGKAACIYAVSEENSAGYNRMVGLALHTSAFDLDNAERMRISANGSVGIGTTGPISRLDIRGSHTGGYGILNVISTDTSLLCLDSTGARDQGIRLKYNGVDKWLVGMRDTNEAFSFSNASDTRLVNILQNGNVGIGSTAPVYKLDVNGGIASGGVLVALYSGNYNRLYEPAGNPGIYLGNNSDPANYYDNSTHYFRNRGGSSNYVIINSSGNLGIGTSSPVQKLHVVGAVYGTTYGQFGTSVASGTNSSYAVFGSNSAVVGVKINIDSNVNRNDLVVSGSTGNVGIGTSQVLSKLNAYASGSNLSVFRVDGGNGTLFEVTDQLSGSLFSVNDVSGLPLLEVFSNNRVVAGKYGSNALVVSGSSVGIGTATPAYKLQVNGSFAATTKSFVIKHPDPAKSDKQLVHGVTEGPEHSVFVRGKLENNNIIQLPDYWQHLVHEESITVTLTPNKYYQQLYVKNVTDTTIEVGSETDKPINCYYYIVGERKDIPKLITEI